MALTVNTQNIIIIISVIIFFLYDRLESKRIKDEREEMIQLKSYAFVQKANILTLFLLSIYYYFVGEISGLIIIFVLVFSSLYLEVFAKFYFRKIH